MNNIFVLGSILIHIIIPIVQAQDQVLMMSQCPTTSNFTSNSPYQTNINRLLSSLLANGTRYGFYNTTIGSAPNTVYGLVSCRGDLSMRNCGACLSTSTVEVAQLCPNARTANLRYEACFLSYSNTSFFSQVNYTAEFLNYRDYVSGGDFALYNQRLGDLIRNLSTTAASRQSRYASGTADFNDFHDIYGFVQCTGDLSTADCFSCLQSMITFLPNCCNGSESATTYSTTCIIMYDIFPFLQESPPPPPPPPPSVNASPPEQSENGGGNSTNVIAIVVPTVAGVVLLAICAYLIVRRIRKSKTKKNPDIIYDRDDIRSEDSLQFDLNTIRIATNDFSDTNKLGEGGFGAVYKGKLLDGQEFAVKRLSKNSGQGSQEFENEVVLLHKLQHRNLVRLLGFCLAGEEKLLIYEYVSNRSLDKYIFDPIKRPELDWERRYKIIRGIARGLLYLHEDSRLRIIHRDLKAGNVLLDEEMNAKIADFGMAKLFGVDQTQGNTNRIAGTCGYIAPEYALHGLFSVKSDVFSFGVLLLEIVSGQKTNNFHMSGLSRDLLSYVWKVWKEGEALKLMDSTLRESYKANEVMRCIHIGLLCVQENLNDRPNMSSVVLMLNNYSLTLESPSAPAFILETRTGANDPRNIIDFNHSTSSPLWYSSDGDSFAPR